MLGRVGVNDLLGSVRSGITRKRALPVLEEAIEVPASREPHDVRVDGASNSGTSAPQPKHFTVLTV